LVRIDPSIAEDMEAIDGEGFRFSGVPVELSDTLLRQIEFYRVLPGN
jgi:hypothetical protein